ncbi:MAG: TldD/PmbA family protein [Bacillota bacterium]|nr:TldD/PmbA family protein [Bacillota bacterium]
MDPNLKDRISSALAGCGGDFADIRVEIAESTRVAYRGGRLEAAAQSRDVGGIVRVLVGGRWGIATFNDLGDLAARLREARDCGAATAEGGDVRLAETEPVQDDAPAPMVSDWRTVALADKLALACGYSDLLMGQPLIKDARASLSERFSQCYYANSEGALIYDERPYAVISFSATARDSDQVQEASRSLATRYDYGSLAGREDLALEAARRARALLAAPPVKGGVYPVILSPEMGGLFVHEAFGHLSEADFQADNPQAQAMMTLGRKFGRPILNVVDDASLSGLRGSLKYDDEGVRTGPTYLIREGVLFGRLHHRESAGIMGERVTGNARATFYRYPPIVRMTNTAILGGETPFEEMLAGIKLGVYAVNAGGGQTMFENFAFACPGAYMIRDGKVAELVRDVNFGGNLFETLANIDAVGNDFRWAASGGGCGKGQEMMLPVGMGAPHVRVQGVLIGGR